MKKPTLFILMLIFALMLFACEKQSDDKQVSDSDIEVQNDQSMSIYVPEEDNIVFSGSLHSKNLLVGSGNSNGFYSLEVIGGQYANIMYTDYQSGRKMALCNRPECTHDNDSCAAYEGEGANFPQLLALEDKLVFIYPGNPYYYDELGEAVLPHIDVSNLDGSNKRTIITFDSEIKTNLENIAYDDDNLYVLQELIEIKGDTIDSSLQFQQVNLSSGEVIRVVDFPDSENYGIYFIGTTSNNFIFKRIINGEWNETESAARERWDNFVEGQVHEIFTISENRELSNALITFQQGNYYASYIDGMVFLTSKEGELVSLNPDTGVSEELIELPYEQPVMYSIAKALLGDWLILDLQSEGSPDVTRLAVNTETSECKELTLATNFEGLTEPYVIYEYFDDTAIVRTNRYWNDVNMTMSDGTVENTSVIVDEWSLMKIEDFLNNKDVYEIIQQ